jgi:integrase
MPATGKKRGRKPKPYVCPWNNKTIDGLRRRPSDGRWELADGRTFVEPDERKAVDRFREMTGGVFPEDDERLTTLLQAHAKSSNANETSLRKRTGITPSGDDNSSLVVIPSKLPLWEYVAFEIRKRPIWVAEQTGIEWIGYGPTLKLPEPLPTLKHLETVWEEHCDASDEQRRKVLHDWRDFVKTTGIESLSDITPQLVISYRDAIYARKMSGSSQRNVFTRVRRLVSFAKSRALAMEACSKALDALSLLVPSATVISLDPKPIDPADFKALLGKAEGDDKAMLLLMLNCAMYLAEVIRLEWSEIKNGCIITHRAKTGACVRVAVLWPETLAALAKVKRKGDYIFYAYHGAPLGVKGAELRFRTLREAAKVEHVTSSQMRDGAYTAAVEAGVTSDICRVLVGHRSGMLDHYVKRAPKQVAPACEAIRARYLAAGDGEAK